MSTKTAIRPPDTTGTPRTVALTDRVALRIGMALIVWSRRTRRAPRDPELVRQARLDTAEREQQWELEASLLRGWR